MSLEPDDPRHGTDNGYRNLGCRCDACRAAHTRKFHEDTWRRAARAHEAPHGTAGGYSNWRCRCQPCTDAHTALMRGIRTAKR